MLHNVTIVAALVYGFASGTMFGIVAVAFLTWTVKKHREETAETPLTWDMLREKVEANDRKIDEFKRTLESTRETVGATLGSGLMERIDTREIGNRLDALDVAIKAARGVGKLADNHDERIARLEEQFRRINVELWPGSPEASRLTIVERWTSELRKAVFP